MFRTFWSSLAWSCPAWKKQWPKFQLVSQLSKQKPLTRVSNTHERVSRRFRADPSPSRRIINYPNICLIIGANLYSSRLALGPQLSRHLLIDSNLIQMLLIGGARAVESPPVLAMMEIGLDSGQLVASVAIAGHKHSAASNWPRRMLHPRLVSSSVARLAKQQWPVPPSLAPDWPNKHWHKVIKLIVC